MTLSLARTAPGPDLRRIWTDAPAFAGTALFLALAMVPLMAAMTLDTRVFQGDSPWLKPVKFHMALSIYLVTLAFFARYLPPAMRGGRVWRGFVAAVVLAVLAEVMWIGGAAALNTASHFNREIPLLTMVYPLMGAFAVLLTSASLVMGIAIWRNHDTGLSPALHLAVALALGLTFLLTVPVAGYMSGQPGHHVGISTRALWVMGWSRDAGDLRVAHFLATHALHAVPLAALILPRIRPVLTVAAVWVALTIGTFAQALMGQPFL